MLVCNVCSVVGDNGDIACLCFASEGMFVGDSAEKGVGVSLVVDAGDISFLSFASECLLVGDSAEKGVGVSFLVYAGCSGVYACR